MGRQGWIKHFKDGTSEVGFDYLVESRKVSWQRGRLDGLVAIDLYVGPIIATLSAGEKDYWQSDTMVAKFSPFKKVKGEYLVRRIQCRLTNEDIGKYVYRYQYPYGNRFMIKLGEPSELPPAYLTDSWLVKQEHIGRWLVVSGNLETKALNVSLEKRRK